MRLSIITCTKNSEKYLGYLINSIRKQNYTSMEHIFVDGDSKDETLKILGEYSRKSSYPVKVFKRKPKGISDAMNYGFKKSSGDVVVFVQSDDTLYGRDTLKIIMNKLENSRRGVLIGKCFYINERNEIIAERPKKIFFLFFRIFPKFFIKKTNFVSHSSVYIKRKILEKEKEVYNLKLRFTMDYELWLRLFKKNKIIFLYKKISCFRYYSQGLSSNPKNKREFKLEEIKLRKIFGKK
jgi:glycosyltransferase involved in cell wall biosynthesis